MEEDAMLQRSVIGVMCALAVLTPMMVGQTSPAESGAIDRDLMEISVPALEKLYAKHKYTVTQVTEWYLARIERYNGTYRAVENVDREGALATAAAEDKQSAAERKTSGPLWGVPIVIKENTSVKGLVTSDGWIGYLKPGKELVAPKDATVVAKLRAAGVVILGKTNMPDFAASDTNVSTAYGRTGNAYDVHFSPGGSSGGTATTVAGNMAVFGTGTDTANSIRQPSGLSSLVGVLPTRGLVSIAGIAPLDWMLDNTGPLARDVTTAAIALGVMTGEDPLDPRTKGSAEKEKGPYTQYLKKNALKGMRFAIPAFILNGADRMPASAPAAPAGSAAARREGGMKPETRAALMKAVEQMRAAGATVLIDDTILPEEFALLVRAIDTRPYRAEGTENFLKEFGPESYHSTAEYEAATGDKFPPSLIGNGGRGEPVPQRTLEDDPKAEETFWGPQKKALEEYDATMKRLNLDGFVYPALQEPNFDETAPGARHDGPHSATGWVNRLGVPAVVVPGGFYDDGMPFGLEISGPRWKDGELLGFAYSYEQATHNRRLPKLKE
jgi:amidase